MVLKREEGESELSFLARQCMDDSERWFGDSHVVHSIPHHTLAMAGEVGEFANLVKKVERGSLSIQDANVRYQLASELTDVFVYMLNLAGCLNVDLGKMYLKIRANNEQRFTAERIQRENRARAEQEERDKQSGS